MIVRDGEVIATGANRVVPNSDPTAHAEVMAIRNACKKLGTFQLTGCTVYSSCDRMPSVHSESGMIRLIKSSTNNLLYGNFTD